MIELIRQKNWSADELNASGFAQYTRKKQLVMARRLPEAEAPLIIEWPAETLIIGTEHMLCYDPGTEPRPALADYDFWPVRIDIFERSYRRWDEKGWVPNAAQAHLLRCGCLAYYKSEPVWAKQVVQDTYVQSVESPTPVLVHPGGWVLISTSGEPWYMDEETFRTRYTVPDA